MGEHFPAVTYREIVHVVRYLGFHFYRQGKGSHEIWRRNSDGRQTTIPHHSKKVIKRKTLRAIFEDCQISAEEFKHLLH